MLLTTERLVLRRFRPSDADTLAAYRNLPEVARYQSWQAPYSVEKARYAIETMAVEVERVGEGQRFTAKLLAERERVAPPMDQGPLPFRPAVTPH